MQTLPGPFIIQLGIYMYKLHFITSYLVDLLLRVVKQSGEVRERIVVEHSLCLLIGARDDVPHRPQCRRLHFDFAVRQQRHQLRNDVRVDNHLDLFVAAIR